MRRYQKILFVTHGVKDEASALKQAISLARNHKASLDALIVCPELPPQMGQYKEKYENSLIQLIQQSVNMTREQLKVTEAELPVSITVNSGETPALRMIRKVIDGKYDLLIKDAEPHEAGKGFKALDMELLRKCPCPVWLCRPISHHRDQISVAVAIDPFSTATEGHDLSVKLLQSARALADSCNKQLRIISCWHYEYETYLKGNVWIKLSDDELLKIVMERKEKHHTELEKLVQESGIQGINQITHLKGRAELIIPEYIENERIDILVMGTVARTGIHGFVIGNTAENILQKLNCSLLAMKPDGFIAPVKS